MTRALHLLVQSKKGDGNRRRFACGKLVSVGSPHPYVRDRLEFGAENVGEHNRCVRCVKAIEAVPATPRPDAPPAVHATKQAPIDAFARAVLARSIRGEPEERHPHHSLEALLEHMRPVMKDGRPIRSGSDVGGDRIQLSARGSDPATGYDNFITSEKALAKVARAVVEHAECGAVLGGVGWSRDALVAVVMSTSSVEAKAVACGRTEHQVTSAHRLMRNALTFELVRIGILPKPRRVVERLVGATSGTKGIKVYEPDTDPKRLTEETMAKIPGYPLQGWKQVARHVERSEDWCKARSTRPVRPFPIKRLGREVYGSPESIDAWMRAEVEEPIEDGAAA